MIDNRDDNENIPQNNEYENDSVRVTPWEVVGHVDYDRLIKEFGTQPIDSEIIEKFQKDYWRSPSHAKAPLFFLSP